MSLLGQRSWPHASYAKHCTRTEVSKIEMSSKSLLQNILLVTYPCGDFPFCFIREVAEVIISCDRWMEAMKHSLVSPSSGIRETPIRLLIKHFPDLAKKVRWTP